MLICENAYIDDNRIRCKHSGLSCAHVKYCEISMKWKQTEQAKYCPGRREK